MVAPNLGICYNTVMNMTVEYELNNWTVPAEVKPCGDTGQFAYDDGKAE